MHFFPPFLHSNSNTTSILGESKIKYIYILCVFSDKSTTIGRQNENNYKYDALFKLATHAIDYGGIFVFARNA